MKLKFVIVDLEMPPTVKRWALRLGIPAVVLMIAAVALAAPVHVWNTGDTLNAADLNGNFATLQEQITALQTQVHPASAFRAILTQAVTIQSSANGTQVVFDTAQYDLNGEYDKTTGVFTPKQAGYYLLTCELAFNPGMTIPAAWATAFLAQNGNSIDGQDSPFVQPYIRPVSVVVAQLAAGDAVTCNVDQTSGAAAPLWGGQFKHNAFSAARLY